MSDRIVRRAAIGRWGICLSVGLLLSLGGCGLDELEIPELSGPAELALSVRLTAAPDIIVADGFSTSLVQAHLRGPNGEALAGRAVFVGISDELGRTADIGQLRSTAGTGGIGTGLVLITGSNGIAQAVYESPVRTDFTANGSVLIQARPIGDDFEGAVYKTVRIELRSAEPRLFPQEPGGNDLPTCGFTIEPSAGPFRVNRAVLFQTTSSDTDGRIIRYEWFFGDGTSEIGHADTNHVFRFPGTYIVTHVVTDNLGGRSACSTEPGITVIP
jgi:hypothetical protein